MMILNQLRRHNLFTITNNKLLNGIRIVRYHYLSPPKVLGSPQFTPVEGVNLRFDQSASNIDKLSDEIIARSQQVHDEIASLTPEACNFSTVFAKLGQLESWSNTYASCAYFPQYVSTDKDLREASSNAQKKLSAFEIQAAMREDLYKACQHATKNNDTNLSPEDQRLVEKVLLEFKRNGLDLPEEKRNQLKEKLTKLSELSIEFAKNIGEDDTTILLSQEELEGMPEDYLSGLETKGEGADKKFVVTMKYPDVNPLLEMCSVSETRRKVEFTYGARCKSNIDILEEALALRYQAAQLMGYKNHAEFVLENKMAKSPQKVLEFLDSLRTKLADYGHKELPVLLKTKQEFEKEATEVKSWDLSFCKNLLLKNHFKVDHDKIKEYYPLEHVTTKMLDIYQDVLNLDFDTMDKDPQPWNKETPEDVKLIRVRDRDTQELMGYFYLDLFPRVGKYSHAACFPIQPGCELDGGHRQVPVAAMVANFSKPTATAPSLLRHSELTTYFHELGHVMHSLCSRTKWARFHGTNVEGDFVEAPSQMLENWCWNPDVLELLSSHHKTKETIPKDLTASLIRSKNAGSGMFYLRQLFYGLFDMHIHSIEQDAKPDTTALYAKLRKEIALVAIQPGTYPASTFGHIMGGYDAGYYGYLWSEVFSADMFATKFAPLASITGPKAGLDYRRYILQPGGSRDGTDMLKDFLGREPSSDPFLKSIVPPTDI